MHVTVTGKNVDITERLRAEAIAKLGKVNRLFDRLIDMEVVFSEEGNPRIQDRVHCEVVVHAKGKVMRATGAASDPLTAIDRAEHKLVRQVRKYKTKLVSRSRQPAGGDAHEAVPADELDVSDDTRA